MELSGFRVSVYSDGEDLKEYSVEVSPDGKKVTCWVPSQSGKEFVVKYTIKKSSAIKDMAKSVHAYVDGRRMRKSALLPRKTSRKITGVRTSDNTVRPFKFTDVQTTDEDTLPDDIRAKPDKIGTISVRVFLVENWRLDDTSLPREYGIQDLPPAVVDERKKKVGGHCVSLGDEQSRTAGRSYSMDYDSQKPDLVFEFHYRSIAMLQALGIIPPPKREAPPIVDVDDEDIPPPPKRQKAVHGEDLMQSMQAELERLRRRVGELEGKKGGPSGVKKETGVIRCDPADIIDLT